MPRIWEKLKAGLEAMLAAQPEEQREKAQAAMRDAPARRCASSRPASRCRPSSPSRSRRPTREIFAGLRTMLGLDQVEAINVGAAPTPVEVLEFFHAIGLPLAELWGMSETCGAGSVNPPEKIKIGTVGPAAPGVELKLAEDGEVLITVRCRDARLPQPAGEDRRGVRPTTASCAPATSASSTRTAT